MHPSRSESSVEHLCCIFFFANLPGKSKVPGIYLVLKQYLNRLLSE